MPLSRLHLSLITPERPITVGSPLKRVDDVLIAKILGHRWADQEITGRVYNRWDKLPEMREALERWASKLEQIATGVPAKVVKMR